MLRILQSLIRNNTLLSSRCLGEDTLLDRYPPVLLNWNLQCLAIQNWFFSTCCSMTFQWQLKYTPSMYSSLKQVGPDLSWGVVLAHFCLFLANLLLGYILIWNHQYKNSVLVDQPGILTTQANMNFSDENLP